MAQPGGGGNVANAPRHTFTFCKKIMERENHHTGQTTRLSAQHLKAGGVTGIFGEIARAHDGDIRLAADAVFELLQKKFPHLKFRARSSIKKSEIHEKMNKIDPELGTKLFVPTASIQPDGRVTEVEDKHGNWRVVFVGEAKFQGKDVENISSGSRTEVMEEKGQYIMPAGNAIERVHKNIQELKNFMLGEGYFPYVVFLQGSNFLVEPIELQWPEGDVILLDPASSMINRIDRVTASNYGMPINQSYCKNKIVDTPNGQFMLQVTSIYARESKFSVKEMAELMTITALESLEILSSELPDAN